jgi:hypothetical protein
MKIYFLFLQSSGKFMVTQGASERLCSIVLCHVTGNILQKVKKASRILGESGGAVGF